MCMYMHSLIPSLTPLHAHFPLYTIKGAQSHSAFYTSLHSPSAQTYSLTPSHTVLYTFTDTHSHSHRLPHYPLHPFPLTDTYTLSCAITHAPSHTLSQTHTSSQFLESHTCIPCTLFHRHIPSYTHSPIGSHIHSLVHSPKHTFS